MECQYSIPLHDPSLHFLVCLDFPLQSLPPPEGGGLVQVRVLVILPFPQFFLLLHSLYADQSLHLPSTETVQSIKQSINLEFQ